MLFSFNLLRNIMIFCNFLKNILCIHWFFAVSAFCLLLPDCISVFLHICAVYEQFTHDLGRHAVLGNFCKRLNCKRWLRLITQDPFSKEDINSNLGSSGSKEFRERERERERESVCVCVGERECVCV